MTTEEFSNEFDTLLGVYLEKYAVNNPNIENIKFDEYEKSVLLTKAQEDVVRSIYTGMNSYNDYFDKNEEIRTYLNNITLSKISDSFSDYTSIGDNTNTCITYPDIDLSDIMFIVTEYFNGNYKNVLRTLEVRPMEGNEWYYILMNPFKKPNNYRIYRTIDNNKVKLYINKSINPVSYTIRYIKKPEPIILTDLTTSGVSINGKSIRSECELHNAIHRIILDTAVDYAISNISAMYNNNNNNNSTN